MARRGDNGSNRVKVHPAVVRVTHWINALAVLIMMASGWQIYNASPLFSFSFPDALRSITSPSVPHTSR